MMGGGVPYRTRCLICVKLRVSYETWSHIRTRSLNGILIKPNPWVSYETTLYIVNFELVMILTLLMGLIFNVVMNWTCSLSLFHNK